jgi:hypothetical protein
VSSLLAHESPYVALTERYHQDQAAAMALVTLKPETSAHASGLDAVETSEATDVDIKRANDLLELHTKVGSVGGGIENELQTGRDNVRKAIKSL